MRKQAFFFFFFKSRFLYLQQVSMPCVVWQASYAQLSLLCAMTYTERHARLDDVTMQQLNGIGSYDFWSIFGIGKTTILTTEVHHEPELPEWTHSAEQRNQHVLVGIPWNMSDEDFTPGSWSWSVPLWLQNGDDLQHYSHCLTQIHGTPQIRIQNIDTSYWIYQLLIL